MKNRTAKQTKHMIKNLQPKHLTASVKDYNSTIKGTMIVLRDVDIQIAKELPASNN